MKLLVIIVKEVCLYIVTSNCFSIDSVLINNLLIKLFLIDFLVIINSITFIIKHPMLVGWVLVQYHWWLSSWTCLEVLYLLVVVLLQPLHLPMQKLFLLFVLRLLSKIFSVLLPFSSDHKYCASTILSSLVSLSDFMWTCIYSPTLYLGTWFSFFSDSF